MIREQTYSSVAHPDPLNTENRSLILVTDPVADRISKGDPTLGWEGDPRFALYLDPYVFGTWELWRLEADGVYRCSHTLPGATRGIDAVGQMILWLVQSDTRKGFDLLGKIATERERYERNKQREEDEFTRETAERLDFALRKDGVL